MVPPSATTFEPAPKEVPLKVMVERVNAPVTSKKFKVAVAAVAPVNVTPLYTNVVL